MPPLMRGPIKVLTCGSRLTTSTHPSPLVPSHVTFGSRLPSRASHASLLRACEPAPFHVSFQSETNPRFYLPQTVFSSFPRFHAPTRHSTSLPPLASPTSAMCWPAAAIITSNYRLPHLPPALFPHASTRLPIFALNNSPSRSTFLSSCSSSMTSPASSGQSLWRAPLVIGDHGLFIKSP